MGNLPYGKHCYNCHNLGQHCFCDNPKEKPPRNVEFEIISNLSYADLDPTMNDMDGDY